MNQISITDASLQIPSLAEIWSVLALQSGYNSAVVVIGTTFLGLAAGIVGTFALLRKRALMGDALAHSALPGLVAAFIITYYLGFDPRNIFILLFGATVSGVLGVLTVQFLVGYTRLKEDAAIGAVLSVYFGVGVTLLSVVQSLNTGQAGGLHHFIYGQTAAMGRQDAMLSATVAILAIVCAGALLKEFRLVCFDHEFAKVQGWSVSLIDLLMMSLVVVTTVIGLQAVGLILIIALLVIPPVAARFWSDRFDRIVLLSGGIGAVSCYLGASASALLPRMPTGAVIVLISGVVFILSFFCAPRRGVVAQALRTLLLRVRISTDHFLRRLYELVEQRLPARDAQVVINERKIEAALPSRNLVSRIVYLTVRASGFLRRVTGGVVFTTKGLDRAGALTRNHRLWEEYMLAYGNLATSHVDYSADLVEHILSPEIVAEIEASLSKKGLRPKQLPESVHPLAGIVEGDGALK